MTLLTKEHLAIATKNGIKIKTVYNRVYNNGMDVEEAITKPTGYREPTGLWATWKKLAEENGVTKVAFYTRVRKGKKPQLAATEPLQPRCLIPSWVVQKARGNGINSNVLNQRVHRYHWNYERACTEPVGKRGGKRK